MKLRIVVFLAFLSNIAFSQNFHDTQGKLEISNSGQAVYTLPIALPPSIKDVGPVINLSYNSGNSGGIAGQGWTISTISAISRISSRLDIDGLKDGVDFDDNDKLALNGQRLLLKTGTGDYWSDNSQYETEIQSNEKIELKGSGSSMYFIVTSPDGSRAWYGNYGGTNGTDVTAFYIVRFEDIHGNFMTYHYAKPYNKSLCITEIKFSANTITNPTLLNRILFTYKLAARKESAYIKGIKIEKVELLDKIEVFTNGLLFRKYQLTQAIDNEGYERVSQIQEYNGAGEAANPVAMEYYTTPNFMSENTIPYTDSLNLTTSPTLSGDFDGDGRLDFTSTNQLFTNLFTGGVGNAPVNFTSDMLVTAPSVSFTATTLKNNKINQFQSIVKTIKEDTSTTFKVFELSANTFVNSFNKQIAIENLGGYGDPVYETVYCQGDCHLLASQEPGLSPDPENAYYYNACNENAVIKNKQKYFEGDFNGDGISEVFIINQHMERRFRYKTFIGENGGQICKMEDVIAGNSYYLLDLNTNSSTNLGTAGYAQLTNTHLLNADHKLEEYFFNDYNGDGKTDMLVISRANTNWGHYKVFDFKQLTVAPWVELTELGSGVIANYSYGKQMLFGDFNGDSKIDIMMPDANGNGCNTCDLWHIYYSNPNPAGGSYFVKESYPITAYFPNSGDFFSSAWHSSTYYAMDVNKDGKSDLVRVWTSLFQADPGGFDPQNIDSAWQVRTFTNNIGLNNTFTANPVDFSAAGQHQNDDNSRPIPLASSYRYNRGLDSELLMIRYHGNNAFPRTVTFIDFTKDFSYDNLIKKVTQSNGAIVDDITYQNMEPSTSNGGLGNLSDFYSSSESLFYPFIEVRQMLNNKLVSRLQNTSLGVIKKQDFKYHGLAIKLDGIGLLGYRKTARSSWYRNDSDKRMWSVTENYALKRGAPERTYTQLLTGSTSFSFLTSYTSGIVNKVENTYTETTDLFTQRYTILLSSQITTDYLTNVITEKIHNTYTPNYFLPETVTINNYLGTALHGRKVSITLYEPAAITGVGSNYHIGRPSEVTTTSTIYVNTLTTGTPDIKTSKEKFFYTNGNLTKTEKKANGSAETLIENFSYFPNGLLQSKTISATGTTSVTAVSPRTTSYTYDPTNRFIKETIDVEGLITENIDYHPLYGLITKQNNPYNQTTDNTYDNWGKRTQVTDYLGKSVIYNYTKFGNNYITVETGDDGSVSTVESDALARVVRKGSLDINGNMVQVSSEYDYLNRKTRDSEPYFSSSSPLQWTSYDYDDYSRQIKTTFHTGKIINSTYSGLTVTSNDQVMVKSKTANANGHIVIATDSPGGTINYKYDANGNVLESSYDGTVLKMTYDNWGRKIQLDDPSAGIYNYAYNAFGELKTESNPNGTTTYTLNPVGKPMTKTVSGINTNLYTEYNYDPVTKLINLMDTTDLNSGELHTFEYFYDGEKRLEKIYESNSLLYFEKKFEYDDFGRVDRQFYYSLNVQNGKSSSKWIKNIYNNGELLQILDDATSQVLWQVNDVNERGQLTSASLGNGLRFSNAYDSYGYPEQFSTIRGRNTTILAVNTVFDAPRGNLTKRYNSMFNWYEDFQYDTLDRLTSYPNITGQIVNQTYENDGRVKTNNLGTYEYLDSSKKYRNTSITLNPKAEAYYQNRLGIFNDEIEQPKGWVITEPTVVTYDTTVSKTGTGSLKINNTTTGEKVVNSEVWTKINNATPTQYTYSAWVKSDGSNPQAEVLLFMKTETETAAFTVLDQVTSSTSSTWVYIEKTFLVPANIRKLNIRLDNNGTGVLWFDDVRIRKTSDPITSVRELNISYNAFKSPFQIEETGVEKISFAYMNGMQTRSTMFYGGQQTDVMLRQYRKHYAYDGTMEIKHNTITDEVEFLTYIGGDGYSAPIVLKSDGTTQEYLYLHRDYQGSILAITNQSGDVIEKRLFDAWGSVVKIEDGQGNVLQGFAVLDRGYTGHEHLQSVGIIHMNGRLYDPKLHRFLQPDNFIQDPNNTQNYNRYGYVLNNPLRYNDPTGEELLAAVVIGAAISLASYLVINSVNGQPITLNGAFNAAFIGAISGFMSFGVGSCVNAIGGFVVRAGVQSLVHGYVQGALSGIQGGGFWSGFASGSLSSIASSSWSGGAEGEWQGIGGKFADSPTGMIAFGTIVGGAGAALTGGNFWKGAVTGLIVSALNHAMHSGDADEFDQEDPNDKGGVIKEPKVSEMDSRYKIPKGTKWDKSSGRASIVTKKEILQWDSKKGEVEVYQRGAKKHMGGFDHKDKNRRISDPVKNRTPNGGWKIQHKPATSTNLKSITNPRGFLIDAIFGGPFIQMELRMLNGTFFNESAPRASI